jgi:hypothetical protein
MSRVALVLAACIASAAFVASNALGAGSGRDIVGSWTPPPVANAHYTITNEIVETGFEGRLTDSADIICSNAPHEGEVFWSGEQVGSDGTVPIFEGRTTIFEVDENNNCTAKNVRVAFWSPADDRLRVCPNSSSSPEAEPELDRTSPVDQSDKCTDFRRTDDPPTTENKKHVASDYIGKIGRESNKCSKFGPVDYFFRLKRVNDDPIVRVDVFVKKKGQSSYHKWSDGGGGEVNHFNVPISGEKSRRIELPWTYKKSSRWKVRVKTQKKKTYTRGPKFFSACS